MSARKNPPSFVLVDKATGEVVYTKRATGVGTEAINKCVWAGRNRAQKTGRTYFVFLDIGGLRVGSKVSVPAAYAMGITEEIGPQGSAMPSGRKCCSSPDVRPSGQGMRCMNCQRWESDNYLKNPVRVRRNIFTFNNPPSGPADETAARELELYIDNDSQLYNQQFIPIVKNLMLKRRKGIYNRELAVKLFMYLMDAGAKKYVAEFGTRGQKIDAMFNKNTRLQAARAFRDSFETEAELGNYDRLIGPVSNPTYRARFFSPEMKSHETRIRARGIKEAMKKAHARAERLPKEFTAPRSSVEVEVDDVRPNIFTFNNPRKLNTIEQAAAAAGLSIATWAPGDGSTRYRFFKAKPGGRGPWADYHQGDALYTAMGRKDAMSFIVAYQMGRHTRRNPPGKSLRAFRVPRGYEQRVERLLRNAFIWAQAENGQVVTFARPEIAKRAIQVVLSGKDLKNNPSPIDPPGLAELDARMNDLMRKMDAMKKAKTDNGPEYMILLKEAQAVSKERLKLIGLGSHSIQEGFTKRVRPNPLLQTVLLANPGKRRNPYVVVDTQSGRVSSVERGKMPGARARAMEWAEDTLSYERRPQSVHRVDRGATRIRVGDKWKTASANPLTRGESGRLLREAKSEVDTARIFQAGHTRSQYTGSAIAKTGVVQRFGPRTTHRAASRIQDRAARVSNSSERLIKGRTLSNPGIKFPKPGTKMTVAQAMELARKIGDRDLIKQCQEAAKLQTKANRGSKCVIWKTLPIGSPTKIDMVTAFAHYGDSPEDMYKPPKGSKKGPHMYRHKWGEGTGKQKPVPVLAAPGGKAIIKVMGPGQKVGDWMRG